MVRGGKIERRCFGNSVSRRQVGVDEQEMLLCTVTPRKACSARQCSNQQLCNTEREVEREGEEEGVAFQEPNGVRPD